MNASETADNRRRWHIDKGINPAYVLALLTALWAGLVWASGINRDQAVQDQKIGTVEKKMDDFSRTNREDLQLINQKLDRLLERGKQ